MPKYVFFTGGVVSGLGKGITAASLGKLMRARGYRVEVLKLNPYFNVDSKTLSPKYHGETYITEDGRACDLLSGHYERIMGITLSSKNDVTSGEIYRAVIDKERENEYGGQAVQVVPHITDEIKARAKNLSNAEADIVIIEVGGTVGDIEAQPFFEALRQLRVDLGKNNVAYVHVSLVPFIGESGEQKTKPTQHSVKELQNVGIQPDVLVCRSEKPIGKSSRDKLALFCNVEKDCVIENILSDNIYDMPLRLEAEGFSKVILRKLGLENAEPSLEDLKKLCDKIDRVSALEDSIKIGIVSRFSHKPDTHLSLREALFFAALHSEKRVEIVSVASIGDMNGVDALVVTSGIHKDFGELKSKAAAYAKKKNIPMLLIGDGMIYGIEGLDYDNEIKDASYKNARLGLMTNSLRPGSILAKIYKSSTIKMRHHNLINIKDSHFEQDNSLEIIGHSDKGGVVAYAHKKHKFFIGVAFLPQFGSEIDCPNKLLSVFIEKCKI